VVLQPGATAVFPRVRDELSLVGFDIGSLVGGSFSISGHRDLFHRYFGLTPEAGRGAAGSVPLPEALPLERLPENLKGAVRDHPVYQAARLRSHELVTTAKARRSDACPPRHAR
jgi:hypothetical protein